MEGGPEVEHYSLRLAVEFGAGPPPGGRAWGRARYRLRAACPPAPSPPLRLDTRDLAVLGARLAGGGALHFSLGAPRGSGGVLGRELAVQLPAEGLPAGAEVEVEFEVGPGSSALQFLGPAQTAGGKRPYLFTQCQAIHARSFVPCQDSPRVKATFEASVRCPTGLTALMGALACDEAPGTVARMEPPPAGAGEGPQETAEFFFRQPVPIPSYLFALAVGELASRDLGPRCRVWAEPCVVDAAAMEFAETEKFLKAGEDLLGAYSWGRYDLLMLPPSFPYGGMENPCLTFVTPTLLTGDRSLANVVAHEIAHSWTGNLVTNGSWEHFWLNEGFTVFVERKILGRVYGAQMLQLHASRGFLELKATVARLGSEHPHTRLILDLSGGSDPDDAYSKVPYEKGFYFLYFLEQAVGGAGAFEPFLKAYIQAFAGKCVDSSDFVDRFKAAFPEAAAGVDWDAWLRGTGLPPAANSYDDSLAAAPYALAAAWHFGDVMGLGLDSFPEGTAAGDFEGFSPVQREAFLEKLGELRCMQPLGKRTCRLMGPAYGLDGSTNAEVRCAWYKLCADAGDLTVLDRTVEFLGQQGRMKYLRPLYRALSRQPGAREAAVAAFKGNRAAYHPIAAKMVAADLGLDRGGGGADE